MGKKSKKFKRAKYKKFKLKFKKKSHQNQVQNLKIDFLLNSSLSIENFSLPISYIKEGLIAKIRACDTLVIIGETACGKSTQIPCYIYEKGINVNKLIGCTQPRRVAATSLAHWVSQGLNSELGDIVGYTVRFDDHTNCNTKIKYMTDGILLREALSDPLLKKYSVIILDEIHERSVRTDVLLGIVKWAQKMRKRQIYLKEQNRLLNAKKLLPLKVIVMSATMDVDKFSKFLNNCPVVYIEGLKRLPSVKLYYPDKSFANNQVESNVRNPNSLSNITQLNLNNNCDNINSYFNKSDYVQNALITLFQINPSLGPGDILVFMPGKDEIDTFIRQAQKIIQELKNDTSLQDIYFSKSESIYHSARPHFSGNSYGNHRLNYNHNGRNDNNNSNNINYNNNLSCNDKNDLGHILDLKFYPMFAGLPKEYQTEILALQPSNKALNNNLLSNIENNHSKKDHNKSFRKVVVATNIAETSITIPGIQFVIDTGRFKTKVLIDLRTHSTTPLVFDGPNSDFRFMRECLITEFISKDQAWQRSGRAGRDPLPRGHDITPSSNNALPEAACYRLYHESDPTFQSRQHIVPELMRCDLSTIIPMLLKILTKKNNRNNENFTGRKIDMIDDPPLRNVMYAVDKLVKLDIVRLKEINHERSQSTISLNTNVEYYFNQVIHARNDESRSKFAKPTTSTPDKTTNTLSLITILKYLELTTMGDLVNYFPVEPALARLLILSSSLTLPSKFSCNNNNNNSNNVFLEEDLSSDKNINWACSEEIFSIVALLSSLAESSRSGTSGFPFMLKQKNNMAYGENGEHTTLSATKKTQFDGYKGPRGNNAKFIDYTSDHLTLLNIYRAFKSNKANKDWCMKNNLDRKTLILAHKIDQQLRVIAKSLGIRMVSCGPLDTWKVKRTLLSGLFLDCAMLQPGSNKYHLITSFNSILPMLESNYQNSTKTSTSQNLALYIHPTSFTFFNKPKYVVFTDLLVTNKPYMKLVTAVQYDWLTQYYG